jgi:soluble lytic murein transglycosylase-like protein
MRRPKVPSMFAVLCACALSSSAQAEIYKYELANGEVLLTTEPRKGLKLIEIIGDRPSKKPTSSSAASSSTAGHAPKKASGATPSKQAKYSAYDVFIDEAAAAYGLPVPFVKAVIRVESNFNSHAVSPVGAMGLMQLMPGTAADLGVEDAFDPRQNIFGGCKYLRMLTNKYNGDINMVLSAYNAGPGNVDKYSGIPFDATQDYVRDVYGWYQTYKQQAEDAAAQQATSDAVVE